FRPGAQGSRCANRHGVTSPWVPGLAAAVAVENAALDGRLNSASWRMAADGSFQFRNAHSQVQVYKKLTQGGKRGKAAGARFATDLQRTDPETSCRVASVCHCPQRSSTCA